MKRTCDGCGAPLKPAIMCEYCGSLNPNAHPAAAIPDAYLAQANIQQQMHAQMQNTYSQLLPAQAYMNNHGNYAAYSAAGAMASATILALLGGY